MMPALSSKSRLMCQVSGFAMRFTGNFFSEWAHVRGGSSNHALFVAVVACAVGATASGAVILTLVGSPTTQPSVSSISPRAIVRNTGASEATKTAQDQPTVEILPRPAVTGMVAGRDEPATKTEEDHQAEVNGQESRKHSRALIRSREPYWRRPFARAFSPSPRFSSW
jgi:hypothetical protein